MANRVERKFFVGGNWKCTGTKESVSKLVKDLNEGYVEGNKVEVVVAPSSVHIERVKSSLTAPIELAAQNVGDHAAGAFTGSESTEMLLDLGETNALIGQKTKRVLSA